MTGRAAAVDRSDPAGWRPWARADLAHPAPDVAPRLLGAILHQPASGIAVRILEVEAYGPDDPASHSHRGRTAANATMFGPAGHLYVYFTYGMHHCANIVTGDVGEGSAVLVRAAAVLSGADRVRERRASALRRPPADRDLLRGPARLAQALDLDRAGDGHDLLVDEVPAGPRGSGTLVLADDGWRPAEIGQGPRTGVRLAADVPWRWWVAGDPRVSPHRRHPRAEPAHR